MEKRARIASILTFQLTGYDPDSKVVAGEPERVANKFVLIDERYASPLWHHYLAAADAVIAEIDKSS